MGCFPKSNTEWIDFYFDMKKSQFKNEIERIEVKVSGEILEDLEMRYAISGDPRDLKHLNKWKEDESLRRMKYLEGFFPDSNKENK